MGWRTYLKLHLAKSLILSSGIILMIAFSLLPAEDRAKIARYRRNLKTPPPAPPPQEHRHGLH